jgi:aminoglycoside phosphotransferase (APT) family kinase protein
MTVSALDADLLGSAALRSQLPGLPAALDADAMGARLQALLAAPTHTVEECVPGKIWYRGGQGCDLRYALRLWDRSTGELVATTVLGRVLPDASRAAAYHRTRVDPLAPGLQHRLGPLRVPAASAADLGLVVYAFPLDPELPTLAAATDPEGVRQELRYRLGWTLTDCTVQVVRHARDGRCVLRYALGEPHAVYGKVYADPAGRRRQELLAALRGALPGAGRAGVRVPRPLGYLPRIRLSLCGVVPGRTAALADPRERESAVVAAARAAAVLHGAAVLPPASRSLAADVAALRRQLVAIRPVWPDVVAQLTAVLAGVEAQAAGVPALPPTFCHGDFTPAQVLLDPPGTGVVDFDAAVTAEPALDLGSFLAYLRFALAKRPSRAPTPPRDHGIFASSPQVFLSAYAEAAGHRRPNGGAFAARVALYERLALARLAARACLQLKTRRLQTALFLLSQEGSHAPN